MLENPGDATMRVTYPKYKSGGENPYIEVADDFAGLASTTSLAKAQVYATLAVAWELREQRKL